MTRSQAVSLSPLAFIFKKLKANSQKRRAYFTGVNLSRSTS